MLSILLTNVTVIFTKIPVFNRQHSEVVGEFVCSVVVNKYPFKIEFSLSLVLYKKK